MHWKMYVQFFKFLFQFLQGKFLEFCRKLTVYGSAFFTGSLQPNSKSSILCHIGVNDVGIHIINMKSKVRHLLHRLASSVCSGFVNAYIELLLNLWTKNLFMHLVMLSSIINKWISVDWILLDYMNKLLMLWRHSIHIPTKSTYPALHWNGTIIFIV